jgi:hypothetical protein
MKNINQDKKEFADLRDPILIEIGILIRKQPNWYLRINDVNGKLIYNIIDDQKSEVIQSVTVKDFGDQGEKEVVWFGVYDEDDYIPVEELGIELMINVLEAMQAELE